MKFTKEEIKIIKSAIEIIKIEIGKITADDLTEEETTSRVTPAQTRSVEPRRPVNKLCRGDSRQRPARTYT